MKSNTNTSIDINMPDIRFSEFTDDWEQRKLSELTTMHARIGWQNLRTSEFLDDGEYMLITGTDFEDGRLNYETCHYVAKERYDQDKNIQVQNGSILITKDGTLGKVAYVQGLSMPATLNAGVFNVVIKDSNEVDEKYLYQYLKGPFLMDYVNQRATGGTIKHLNQGILVDFPVALPPKEEQVRIGDFLTNLDSTITLHQRKYETILAVRQSMLQKMFPKDGEVVPEIRFAGFSEPWKQYKYEDLGDHLSGGALSYNDLAEDGKYKSVLYGELYTRYDVVIDAIVNRTNKKALTVLRNDILFPQSTTVDNYSLISPACMNEDAAETSGVFVIRPNSNVDGNFVCYYTKGNEGQKRKLAAKAQGTTIIHLYYQSIKDEIVLMPSIEEQKKVSQFFLDLDKAISFHQKNIKVLETVKKSMLEKMFV